MLDPSVRVGLTGIKWSSFSRARNWSKKEFVTQSLPFVHVQVAGLGRGGAVGRGLGDGPVLGVGVGRAVGLALAVAVAVAVALAVAVVVAVAVAVAVAVGLAVGVTVGVIALIGTGTTTSMGAPVLKKPILPYQNEGK